VTVFQPGNRGLAGAHPGREFGLGEARAQPSPEQFGGNLELRRERVILGLDPGIGEQAGFQLLELDGHVISLARRRVGRVRRRNPPFYLSGGLRPLFRLTRETKTATNKEQPEGFMETARNLGVGESGEKFAKAIAKVVHRKAISRVYRDRRCS
jgi:hypothetical protein